MSIHIMPEMQQRDIQKLDLEIISRQRSTLTFQPKILDGIKGAQELDPLLMKLKEQLQEGKNAEFRVSSNDVLHFKGRLCIPNDAQLEDQIHFEAHTTPYLVHSSATNMYKDLKEQF